MSDPRPKWDPGVALRTGVAAHKLAIDHRARLEPRLTAAVIDGLGVDVATLRMATAETPAVRSDKEGATVTQDQAVADGAELVAAVRTAATRSPNADAALRKSLGVGTKVQSTVPSVEAALTAIVAHPGRGEGCRKVGPDHARQADRQSVTRNGSAPILIAERVGRPSEGPRRSAFSLLRQPWAPFVPIRCCSSGRVGGWQSSLT
ncbi:MAG: hypothetical protein HY718_11670 [Planctomycetes bacterium]|nr:hypothetical protein [Planctomycetota bacterium]